MGCSATLIRPSGTLSHRMGEGRGEGGNSAGPADHSATMRTSTVSEARANHARLEERNAVHRRFGFDPDASVRFVPEQALPLRGRVLDIGTGKGRFVIPMARHLAHVTTVDINAEEQRHARLEAVHAGVADRIRFVTHDARALPWPAACFDAVVSWNVFHHPARRASDPRSSIPSVSMGFHPSAFPRASLT